MYSSLQAIDRKTSVFGSILAIDNNPKVFPVNYEIFQVISWSRPVSRTAIERVARALGVSSTDVVLFAATDALRAFFEQAHGDPPDIVLTTARAASEDFLFTFAEGQGKMYKKSQTGGE